MLTRNYEYDDYGMNSLIVWHTRSHGLTMPLRHLHSQYEFLFVKEGHVVIESNAATFEITRPCLVIHKPFSLHRANADSDLIYDRFVINISAELLGRIKDLIPNFSFLASSGITVIPVEGEIEEKMTTILTEVFDDYKAGRKQRALLDIATFLLDMTEYASESGVPVPHSDGYIGEVIKYISMHYADDIKIDELADYFFVSRSKLISDFKRSIGVPIKKYTMFVRISNAQYFLNTGKSISETATLCGFYDNSHFISTFRTLTGKTPKEYCRSLDSMK